MLVTSPWATGSNMIVTIGIVVVAALAATAVGQPLPENVGEVNVILFTPAVQTPAHGLLRHGQ